MTIQKNFKNEQNIVLKKLLENRFFKIWEEGENNSLFKKTFLEIYLSASCNQNCDYCYLIQNKDQIYPKEFDNKEKILSNLNLILNWIKENKYSIDTIELFSGEIWHTDFGLNILKLILNFIKQEKILINQILIPSNCSFILDKKQMYNIQRIIDDFQNQTKTQLIFSISVDGLYIEDYRPLNDKEKKKDNAFFTNLFTFAKHNNYKFHPMVSAKNIKDWIKNWEWWKLELLKYGLDPMEELMMLEVRNNDWDEKSINDYIKFLQYLLFTEIDQYPNLFSFFESIFKNKMNRYNGYYPFCLPLGEEFSCCSIVDSLTIRAGDLSICPCHRLAYNKYLYGKFIVENERIIDIKANNPEIASCILLGNNILTNLECHSCLVKEFCLKGCYGAQYEVHGDPLISIDSVCNFFIKKYYFLCKFYNQVGLQKWLKTIEPYDEFYLKAQQYLDILRRFDD